MRYSANTTLPAPDVLRRARETFGMSGLGLRLTSQHLLVVRFEQGSGFVAVEAQRSAVGATEVIIETRELDAEVLRFLRDLPRQSLLRSIAVRMRDTLL